MIPESIKNRKKFSLEKHGMEFNSDPRIIKALKNIFLLSSNKFYFA